MAVPVFFIIPALKYQLHLGIRWPLAVYLLLFCATTVSVIAYYGVAVKAATGKLLPHALGIPLLMSFAIGLSVANSRAVLEALFGHTSEFVRTPKFRIEHNRDTWRKKRYRSRSTLFGLIEFLVAVYFSAGMVYFFSEGFYASLPFFFLFQFGFFYISLSSLAAYR
jgi:hypothetical protein